jgi:selenocysteine lyase/cysteine desulfurase
MERSTFLKSIAGAGVASLGLGSLSFKPAETAGIDPDVMPSYISGPAPDFNRIREDFPRVKQEIYMDNASTHPINIYTAAALHRYAEWAKNEVGEPWWPLWSDTRLECKASFAKLINADPEEIAFARTTVEAENNILNGMDFKGGNVVTTDLHYSASLYSYKMREQRDGLKVKIIKHNDWKFNVKDFEGVIDKNTKLVAITLVSNVNGFVVEDVKKISDLAHANGAVLYVDFIQGVGAVPVDVKAMGIDIAACSTFKWLMGSKGFGFMYVRKDLQDTVVRTTHHNGGISYNYAPWVDQVDPSKPEISFKATTGPGMYEVSYPSYEGVSCAIASLKYIHELGVNNIRNHTRTLTNKLAAEMPRLGYPSITPAGNESPIIVFVAKNPEETMTKLRAAKIHVAMRFGNKLRISPSIYNNLSDIDKLLEVLS